MPVVFNRVAFVTAVPLDLAVEPAKLLRLHDPFYLQWLMVRVPQSYIHIMTLAGGNRGFVACVDSFQLRLRVHHVLLLDGQSVCHHAPPAGEGIVALDEPADPHNVLTADTKACRETFQATMAAAGGAYQAVEMLCNPDSTARFAYLTMRPPGECGTGPLSLALVHS